jgi:hypothetical protein
VLEASPATKQGGVGMKLGDKKQHKVVKFTGNHRKDVLAVFDHMAEQDEEARLMELHRKKRDVNEAAKKLF